MTSTSSSSADPASMINCTVKIQNLVSKPELNSQIGIVKSYNTSRDRYNVQLYSASPIAPPIALKVDNLVHATLVEKAKGQLEQVKTMIQFVRTDPDVRRQILDMYHSFQTKLPSGIKPEYAIGGVLFLLFALTYMIGFTKLIMLMSIIGILLTVILPDIMAGETNVKHILRNFPARWRNTIHDHTGYHLSPKVANGLLFIILLLTTKVLVTPSIRADTNNTAKLTNTELDMMMQQQQQQHNDKNTLNSQGQSSSLQSWTLEEIYKLGYEDGVKKYDYGTSLPENHETILFSSSSGASFNDDFEYDYKPTQPPLPPHQQKKSKLGFSTLMAMFALFRSVKELGFANGRFDVNYFKTNIQMMPPLKMAFLGFMLYRVVSAFI